MLVHRFGTRGEESDEEELPPRRAAAALSGIKINAWPSTERTRLERMVMQHGFHNWNLLKSKFFVIYIYFVKCL